MRRVWPTLPALLVLGALAADANLGGSGSVWFDIPVVAAPDSLAGLWSRHDAAGEGAPVRFWYFHGDGHGLYRYGKVGYTNTHSFDYTVVKDTPEHFGVENAEVELVFRKTGVRHRLRARVSQEAGERTLRFDADPRESGATYRYTHGPISAGADSPDSPDSPDSAAASGQAGLAGHMWMDPRSFATGGMGFALYQFGPAAIDGRGVGWFHEGDFDEWRTEAMTYRITGDRLALWFDLAEELGETEFVVESTGEGHSLVLAEDPRDFWLTHRYRDVGRSFGESDVMRFVVSHGLASAD